MGKISMRDGRFLSARVESVSLANEGIGGSLVAILQLFAKFLLSASHAQQVAKQFLEHEEAHEVVVGLAHLDHSRFEADGVA
mmetsp:Transcript_1743/g.2442  ORF Transcript_1743/g.2442 Transcript_1743/m.2442 type:complete len:82 (+) Transcript_1743:48-293(+)